MGYHIIIKTNEKEFTSKYIEKLSDLAYISGINKNSIIYQGEKKWKPIKIENDPKYSLYADIRSRAGIKAQHLFLKQAIEQNLILEELSQDQESFQAYISSSEISIKRGDFLIRNVKNIEIEVKCLSYYNINNEDCIYLKYHEVLKLHNMMSFTKCPVFFAIYERPKGKDTPIENSLKMISVEKILEDNKNTLLDYNKEQKCLIIPIKHTTDKFKLIDNEKEEIIPESLQ